MKPVILILFVVCFAAPLQLSAQHNPYLDRKKKDRPSAVQRREDARHLKKQKKRARKQMRQSKRDIRKANKRRSRGEI